MSSPADPSDGHLGRVFRDGPESSEEPEPTAAEVEPGGASEPPLASEVSLPDGAVMIPADPEVAADVLSGALGAPVDEEGFESGIEEAARG